VSPARSRQGPSRLRPANDGGFTATTGGGGSAQPSQPAQPALPNAQPGD
jgi:hypothetical protein